MVHDQTNPATGVKRYTVVLERTRFLSADDVQTVLQKCKEDLTSPWLLPLVKLALKTGMRQGELLRLTWKGVNLERGTINVLQTKTMRWKTIGINAHALQALNWLQSNRYGDYLFMWPWGDVVGKTTVYDDFKRACKAAGIEDFHFHDLLRTPLPRISLWLALICLP